MEIKFLDTCHSYEGLSKNDLVTAIENINLTIEDKDEFVAIENLYKEYYGESLLDTVKDEFSGDFEDGLVGIYYAMVKPH